MNAQGDFFLHWTSLPKNGYMLFFNYLYICCKSFSDEKIYLAFIHCPCWYFFY